MQKHESTLVCTEQIYDSRPFKYKRVFLIIFGHCNFFTDYFDTAIFEIAALFAGEEKSEAISKLAVFASVRSF